MAKPYLKQLKDKNPDVRISAIKAAARAKDRAAVKQLAVMCEDDPSAEVRSLARKAGLYIRQQLGEIPADDPQNAGADGKTPKYAVTPEIEARSRKLIDDAVAYQLNNELSKALKLLQQSLAMNPNMRYDGYYKSVAEAVTDSTGDEMFAQLTDKGAQSTYSKKEVEQRKQATLDTHLAEVKKANWLGAGMDIAILFFVTLIGVIFAGTAATQSAAGYVDSVEFNWQEARESMAAGLSTVQEDGAMLHVSNTQLDAMGLPKKFTEIIPEPSFWRTSQQWGAVEIGTVAVIGLVSAVTTAVLVFVMGLIIHTIAVGIMRGNGRLPYTMHRVASFFTARAIIAALLFAVGAMLAFGAFGSETGLLVMAGLLGIFGLISLLTLAGMMGKAYNISAGGGIVAVLPAVGVAAGAVFLILTVAGQMGGAPA